MMEQSVSKLNGYFEEQISACGQRNRDLLADDRRDEAVFEKIRANVYDIFRTILAVAVGNNPGDPEGVKRFFMLKTEQIPANWTAAYEKARQHQDAVNMQLEQIKLDTTGEIREVFAKLWEEAQ